MDFEKEPWEMTPNEQPAEPAAEETAEAPAEVPETEPKKEKAKTPVWAIVVIAVLAIALIATAAFAFFRLRPEETPEVMAVEPHHINAHGLPSWSLHYNMDEEGTPTDYYYLNELGETVSVTEEDMAAMGDTVVATCGEATMDNRLLQFFYSDAYGNFYSQYYNYLSSVMDLSAPLDSQLEMLVSGTDTWQKYFLDAAVQKFTLSSALKKEAAENGFQPSLEQEQELASLKDIHTPAMANGYENEDQLVQAFYGPWANGRSYLQYVELSAMASFYLEELENQIALDDAAIEAFYDANATDYVNYGVEKNDQPATVDVRHILIQPEASEDGTFSEEAWAAAETEAQRILDEWTAGEATEDSFAQLATTYTTDPGSAQTGGLYEDVVPGQMVTEFNDWCFDPARQTGDTGIVKTSYGYHIMFYSAAGEELYWMSIAKADLRSEKILQLQDEILAKYSTEVDYPSVVILDSMPATTPADASAQTVVPQE